MPNVKPGDRVRITGMQPGDPAPLPIGAEGTVTSVTDFRGMMTDQIQVDWDPWVGRSLILLPEDPFEVIE